MISRRETEITLLVKDESFTYRHGNLEDSILISAENAGLDLPSSCRAGTCGTCLAIVRSGEVELVSNMFLDDDEIAGGHVLLCQAVPRTPTVTIELIGCS